MDQHPACKVAFEEVTSGESENQDELESEDTLKCQCDLCGPQHAAWKDIEVFPAIDVPSVSYWSVQEQCLATDVLRCYRDTRNAGYCSRVFSNMKTAWNIDDHEAVIESAVDRCATMWSFYSVDDPYVVAKPLDGGASGKPGAA